MDTPYHQFEPTSREHTFPKGIKKRVFYFLYAALLTLLLIQLLITGVKFSQLGKDVNEIKEHLTQPNPQPFASNDGHFEKQTEQNKLPGLLPEITRVQGNCREGWVSYENSCYFLSTTEETWNASEIKCQNLQGHLLVINSAEELDYISKEATLEGFYWIGLVERHSEGHWTWVDGSNYSSMPKFWDRGQPDDWDYRENGEDCGQLHPAVKRTRRLWNDADCRLSIRYICESSV